MGESYDEVRGAGAEGTYLGGNRGRWARARVSCIPPRQTVSRALETWWCVLTWEVVTRLSRWPHVDRVGEQHHGTIERRATGLSKQLLSAHGLGVGPSAYEASIEAGSVPTLPHRLGCLRGCGPSGETSPPG